MFVQNSGNRIQALAKQWARPLNFMEVCGTHTMSAFRSGLRSLLPKNINLLSGPGCPVCVTPVQYLDYAIALARRPEVILTTYGDLLRVPGSQSSLEQERARGAQVRLVYSPLDALQMARENPKHEIIFLGVGFETTTPPTAWAMRQAANDGIGNFSAFTAHKTMPQALAALLQGPVRIDGFLCPGHVSTIIGSQPYEFIAREHGIPCVIAGFEAGDMLAGIEMLLRQKIEQRSTVEIQYQRGVEPQGNPKAQAVVADVFEPCDSEWRGLGMIKNSGLKPRATLATQDAWQRWPDLPVPRPREPKGCRCGDILRGTHTPPDCTLFGVSCTPYSPQGACMVSSEGTCAAWFRYAQANTNVRDKKVD